VLASLFCDVLQKWRLLLTYVLDHVAVVADEEDCAALRQVDLHSDQAVSVAGKVVERDALAEIKAALVEGLPVPVREVC
jgi:hypothetical protein